MKVTLRQEAGAEREIIIRFDTWMTMCALCWNC